ncbi:MAG: DegT/DnrJ/EryC1/StrS family aminotransferase, partial [Actinomycetota bacterium]
MSRIWLSHPDVGPAEREALLRAFDSGWIAPTGPEVDAFEHDMTTLTGWPGAVAVASGTAGLHV